MRLFRPSAAGLAALALCLAAGSAAAGNWTFGGRVSERLEARSGLGFDEDDELVFRSTTRLGLGLGYQTPRTDWALNSSASYRQSVGSEGDDEDDDDDGLEGVTDPRLSGSVVHRISADHVVGADLSFRRRSLDVGDSVFFEDDFGEIEFIDVEEDATETTLDFGANWNWSATPRTSFGLGTDVSIRRFSEDSPDLEPSDSIRLIGSVNRVLDARTSGGLSLSYRNFRSDGEVTDEQTDAVILSVNATRQLTPRHTLGVNVGTGPTFRTHESPLLPGGSEDEVSLSFQGGMNFTYLGPRNTTLSLSAQRSLQPTTDGTLANTTTLAVGASRPLTSRISIGLNGAYGRRSSETDVPGRESERGQSLRMSAGLSAELTRRWTASTGVDLRYAQDDGEDDEFSTGVFFQISRALVLNP